MSDEATLQQRLEAHLRALTGGAETSLMQATAQEIRDAALAEEPALVAADFETGRPTGGAQAAVSAEFVSGGPSVEDPVEEAVKGIEALRSGRPPSPRQTLFAAAIVMKKERPSYVVEKDWISNPAAPFEGLAQRKSVLKPRIRAIGRIRSQGAPYGHVAGTGFVVGEGLLMTNRHVAKYFVRGVGEQSDTQDAGGSLVFVPGEDPSCDLKVEQGSSEKRLLSFARPVLMHPYWDVALLKVEGEALAGIAPLELTVERPQAEPPEVGGLVGRDVVVVGYPVEQYLKDRDLRELRKLIFEGHFGIKRLMPGRLLDRHTTETLDPVAPPPAAGQPAARRQVPALGHDASTLAGNSGSALLDPQTGEVWGIHFRGKDLDANFAVPAWELARDPRVRDLGVKFTTGNVEGPDPEVESAWGALD